jgi:hypothetical protein
MKRNILFLVLILFFQKTLFAGHAFETNGGILNFMDGFPLQLKLSFTYYQCNGTQSLIFNNQTINNTGGVVEVNDYGEYVVRAVNSGCPYGVNGYFYILNKAEFTIEDGIPKDYIIYQNEKSELMAKIYYYGKSIDEFKQSKTTLKLNYSNGQIQLTNKVVYLKKQFRPHYYGASNPWYETKLDSNYTEKVTWYKNGEYFTEHTNFISASNTERSSYFAEITTSKGLTYHTDIIYLGEEPNTQLCIDSALLYFSYKAKNEQRTEKSQLDQLFFPKSNPVKSKDYFNIDVCDYLYFEVLMLDYMGKEVNRRKKEYFAGIHQVFLFDDFDGNEGFYRMILYVNGNFSATKNIIFQK